MASPSRPWLTEAAPAKVNLTLHVTGRRQDGLHLLDSLVVFGPPADMLRGAPAAGLSLRVAGPFAGSLVPEQNNLVLRAALTLAAWAGIKIPGAELVLEKNLPVASGIGGGSADAAAALRLLSRLWHLDIPPAALAGMAARLGADVPVCLASRAAVIGGVGEILRPAPRLPEFGLLLVNPGVPLVTADVFRAWGGGLSQPADWPASWTDAAAMAADLASHRNDLEAPALTLCPAVGEVLAALRSAPGCLLARMSGSGATCFGLFATASVASRAAAAMPAGWWCSSGTPAAFTNGSFGPY